MPTIEMPITVLQTILPGAGPETDSIEAEINLLGVWWSNIGQATPNWILSDWCFGDVQLFRNGVSFITISGEAMERWFDNLNADLLRTCDEIVARILIEHSKGELP